MDWGEDLAKCADYVSVDQWGGLMSEVDKVVIIDHLVDQLVGPGRIEPPPLGGSYTVADLLARLRDVCRDRDALIDTVAEDREVIARLQREIAQMRGVG